MIALNKLHLNTIKGRVEAVAFPQLCTTELFDGRVK